MNSGNITWEKTSEETQRLLTETITISGHYKYNYKEEVIEERRYKNNKRSPNFYNTRR